MALLVESDFLGGVTILASADDDEDELIGIGVVLVDDMDILFLVLVIRFVLTVALMDGDLGVLFAFALGIFSLIGSTFIGGSCKEVTLGGFARLPGNVYMAPTFNIQAIDLVVVIQIFTLPRFLTVFFGCCCCCSSPVVLPFSLDQRLF